MTLIRTLLLAVSVLVGAGATAEAVPLTLNFSGSVDLSGSGGAADNPFNGFFTWETTALPFGSDPPNLAMYNFASYQLIFDGVDKTPLGGGLFVLNDADVLGNGTKYDGFWFLAAIDQNPVIGDQLLVGLLVGPSNTWDTLSLPTDYSFLSQMTMRYSLLSLEVPGGGDTNDIVLGTGSFEVSPIPEPASLTLTGLGLAGIIARARRGRQRR